MKATLRTCGLAVALCAFADLPALSEDGYVESLGQQFVNLRAFKTPNMRMWIDFKPSSDAANLYYFGTRGDFTGSWLACYGDNNGSFYVKYGDTSASFVKLAGRDAARHTLYIALNEDGKGRHRFIFTTEGEEVVNVTDTAVNAVTTTGCPIMLFGLGRDFKNGEFAENIAAMKVYGVKIWEGDDLIHDYVPRKVEGKFYLKDLVDGKYITGAARNNGTALTEQLTGGGDIVEEPGDAYIESHSHERIDLGIKADGTTRAELDHQLVAPKTRAEDYFFGSRAPNETAMTFWGLFAATGARLGYECVDGGPRWNYFDYSTPRGIVPAELRRTLVIDALNGKVAYETADYECCAVSLDGSRNTETASNLGLFSVFTQNGWGTGPTSMKFYGLNIYKNGALAKSFKPYVKDALPGIVDQNGNFLTSGDDLLFCTNQMFKVGGAITGDAGMDDVYLETTGSEYIDTYVTPSENTKVIIDFALTDPGKKDGGFLFGSRDSSTGPYCWIGLDVCRLAAAAGTVSWQDVVRTGDGSPTLNMGRYVLTLDLKAKKVTLKQGNLIREKALDGITAESIPTTTMALMGLHHENNRYSSCSKLRLYSCRIYDGETCLRSYYPRKAADGTICLYDFAQKNYRASTQTPGLKIRGMTVDGVKQGFDVKPPEKVTLFKGDSVTLTASAPFATSYVWRRNGIVIPGETGPSYTVQPGGRRTVLYSVAPVYTVNRVVRSDDIQVEGEPAATEVIFQNGMMLILR